MQQSFTCSLTMENHQEGLLGICRALPPLCSLPLFISQRQRLSLTNDQKMKARRLSGILEVWRPDSGYIFWNSNLSGVGSLYLDDSDILYSIVFCCEVLSWDRWTLGGLVDHWFPSSTVTRNVFRHYHMWETSPYLLRNTGFLEKVSC